jgi:hypothetical protein
MGGPGPPSATIAASARDEERAYLALAARFLEPATPRLLALGGLSGTGKTGLRLAIALGRVLGAMVLREQAAVILDAVHASTEERAAIEEVESARGAAFAGL